MNYEIYPKVRPAIMVNDVKNSKAIYIVGKIMQIIII
jgi:hypothetical protein